MPRDQLIGPEVIRTVNAADAQAGGYVIMDGRYQLVRTVAEHAPGRHPHSPILDHLRAREVVTARGSRWSGVRGPDGEWVAR